MRVEEETYEEPEYKKYSLNKAKVMNLDFLKQKQVIKLNPGTMQVEDKYS